jgi:wyosine [tRNA(Phe)-imidazoG37] synthetase (radical SAM superfamily)
MRASGDKSIIFAMNQNLTDQHLTSTDHSRASAGLRYVYPVVSRRARGVSVGVNLNINNACNWRCIYCQVPALSRGGPPPVDLNLLEQELRDFLAELLHGDFMQRRVPEGMRRINDIALSGNGEPTSSGQFFEVIELLCKLKTELRLPEDIKLVLITNGSMMQRDAVQRVLQRMAQCNGEVWFKLDRASDTGLQAVNDTRMTLAQARQNLLTALACCPNTWLQTCWFALDGAPPSQQEVENYLEFLADLLHKGNAPAGVMLYTLARASLQPEAGRLAALAVEELEAFAERIREVGMKVLVRG